MKRVISGWAFALIWWPLVPVLFAGCASGRQVPLAKDQPRIAERLHGEWVGGWYADKSSGEFELRIESVQGDNVIGDGVWYRTVVATAPFSFSGTFRDGSLWIPRGENRWFDLRLYETDTGKDELRGRYSTVGLGVVYQGDIRVRKK